MPPTTSLPTPRLLDRFGRVGRDLRVSVTDRCNLRCTYCMPAEGLPWLPKPEMLTDEELLRIIGILVGLGVDTVRLTGGEPLLRRSLVDAAMATRAAKERYQRPRPFVENGAPTCTPDDEAALRGNGSYPSGHVAIGWVWALVLTQAVPGHTEALIARGRSFGESRAVCNVHWQSDILAGRFMAAGTFARLQSDAAFRADVAAASVELAAARTRGQAPDRDCAAEAAAMAIPLPGVL